MYKISKALQDETASFYKCANASIIRNSFSEIFEHRKKENMKLEIKVSRSYCNLV